MYFKKLFHPELFQGEKKKNQYFEGWYYKMVGVDELYTLALIPGISVNKEDSHAFIQIFISKHEANGVSLETHYVRYELKDFSYGKKSFWVKIGDNYFSKEKVNLSIKDDDISISGSVDFSELVPIKKNIWMPSIMGIFGYFNFMECYHGVISMSHKLSGSLNINNKLTTFTAGKGYIEKDWGRSFPRAYVWLQSNHFKNPTTSFLFSYADIPFLGFYFKGLIVNLIYQGKEYRFATYNGAKIKLEQIEPTKVKYIIKKGRLRLEVTAYSEASIELFSPNKGEMIDQIKEGVSGFIEIKLYKNKELIYSDEGKHAGIEIMK